MTLKSIRAFVVGLVIGTMLIPSVAMAATGTSISVVLDTVKISINGKPLTGGNFLYRGTTYAPVRMIGEALGKTVGWDNGTVTITDPAPPTPSGKTAAVIVESLKSSGMPIDVVVNFSVETDPNKLMGKPRQYTSKASFSDTSLPQTNADKPVGGSVEVFATADDAAARKAYIDSFGTSPLLAEYSYLNGPILLRLDFDLTPAAADAYKQLFMKITP